MRHCTDAARKSARAAYPRATIRMDISEAEVNASLTGDATVPYRNARVEAEERPEWLALRDMRLR